MILSRTFHAFETQSRTTPITQPKTREDEPADQEQDQARRPPSHPGFSTRRSASSARPRTARAPPRRCQPGRRAPRGCCGLGLVSCSSAGPRLGDVTAISSTISRRRSRGSLELDLECFRYRSTSLSGRRVRHCLPFQRSDPRVTESAPSRLERIERSPAAVVSRSSASAGPARLTPRRLDEPVAAQAAQERIDRPLARDHPVRLGQRADEVEAVPLLVDEEREDAVLERPLAHLRQESSCFPAATMHHKVPG